MIKKILIVVAVLIASFLVSVATRPSEYTVSRSLTIPAEPAAIFPYLNDLKKWNEWSPWAKRDPEAKYTFSGPETGKDASFSWAGNAEVGEGSMTIVESVANEKVRYNLEFKKPFEDRATAELSLKAAGAETEVTRAMSGKNNFVGKFFGVLFNFEKMISADFDQGLANLKGVAGKTPE